MRNEGGNGCANRMRVVLALLLTAAATTATANMVRARIWTEGVETELTALDPGRAASLQEVRRAPHVLGILDLPQMFWQSSSGWLYAPSRFSLAQETRFLTSFSTGQIVDSTLRGSIEIMLEPSARYGSNWEVVSFASTETHYLLSPRTTLTMSAHVSGMYETDGGRDDFALQLSSNLYIDYGAQQAIWTLPQSSQNSGADDGVLELSITNTSTEPLPFIAAFGSRAAATLSPAIVPHVPEPRSLPMLATGGLVVAGWSCRRKWRANARRIVVSRFAAMMLSLVPLMGQAQTLDVAASLSLATVHVERPNGGSLQYTLPLTTIYLGTEVWQSPYATDSHSFFGASDLPYPIDMFSSSGASWASARAVDAETNLAVGGHLAVDSLPQGSIMRATMGYYMPAVAIPARSLVTISALLEISVLVDNPSMLPYRVVAHAGSTHGPGQTWWASGESSSTGTLPLIHTVDNRHGSDWFYGTGFGSGIDAMFATIIPEPHAWSMLFAGLLLLIAGRAGQRVRQARLKFMRYRCAAAVTADEAPA
ncbi:PEP-CTERM sorting domain-containing protein [Pseudoduganella buxea]|uniref:PEP-CTERM sorting domain-containing protein n=1 Tax=Pseudoduganella buxea TaxID=1949069 RepID=A0A6I3T395_9BURK|nr:PEP-CTERM sorting domain-containing protein [Pseudoduganella buxea]MTV55889.1 PEP-CTERM sorting domain-containing protein [Pseudoduganella buxea]GGC20602.1 hypothetical protein GCM10011572_47540 [Pseudoduganella buxea]